MRSPRGSRRPASLRFHAEELPLEQLFSEHELLLLRKRFAKMCENAGGTVRNGLTREGFRTFTGVLGLSHELSDRMFHSFDRDNDDTISVTEYIRGINVMTKGNKEQRIRFAFDMFDENGDGTISKDEMGEIFTSLQNIFSGARGSRTGRSQSDAIFEYLDRDHDGTITYEEFRRGISKHPQLLTKFGMHDNSSSVATTTRLVDDVIAHATMLRDSILGHRSTGALDGASPAASGAMPAAAAPRTVPDLRDCTVVFSGEEIIPPNVKGRPVSVQSRGSVESSSLARLVAGAGKTLLSGKLFVSARGASALSVVAIDPEGEDEGAAAGGLSVDAGAAAEEGAEVPAEHPEVLPVTGVVRLRSKTDWGPYLHVFGEVDWRDAAIKACAAAAPPSDAFAEEEEEKEETEVEEEASGDAHAAVPPLPPAVESDSGGELTRGVLTLRIFDVAVDSSLSTVDGASTPELVLRGEIRCGAHGVEGADLFVLSVEGQARAREATSRCGQWKLVFDAFEPDSSSDVRAATTPAVLRMGRALYELQRLQPGATRGHGPSLESEFGHRRHQFSPDLLGAAPKKSSRRTSSEHRDRRRTMNALVGAGVMRPSTAPGELDTADVAKAEMSSATHAKLTSIVSFGDDRFQKVVVFMKGIQYSVNRASVEGHLELRGFHFLSKDNYDVEAGPDVIGEEDMSWGDLAASGREDGLHIDGISTRSQARFFDYAALVFEKLRRLWGIDAASYLDSLGLESLIRHLMLGTLTSFSEAGSEGKAGGLFYFSSDNHYMLKTIREDEHKMLRQILPAYYDHWRHASEATPGVDPDDGDGESGGGPRKPKGWTSLLCRYCGLHSVTFAPRAKSSKGKVTEKKIYFVVMAQALHPTCRMDYRYDLKGSWSSSRSATTPDEAVALARDADRDAVPVKCTLLDNDFRAIRLQKAPGPPQPPNESAAKAAAPGPAGTRKVLLGALRRAQIIAIIQRDVDFLVRVGALDYSLLLGIHLPSRDEAVLRSPGLPRLDSPGLPRYKAAEEDDAAARDARSASALGALRLGALTQEILTRGVLSPDGEERYFFGIIDLLTPWSDRKKLESFGRSVFQAGASCVAPPRYGKRFMQMIREVMDGGPAPPPSSPSASSASTPEAGTPPVAATPVRLKTSVDAAPASKLGVGVRAD